MRARRYVLPHPISVDHVGPGFLGDANHAPVDVSRHADDEMLRDLGAESVLGPRGLDGLDVPADPAGRDEHGRAVELELAVDIPVRLDAPGRVVGLQHAPLDTDGPAGLVDQQLVHLVSEPELDEAFLLLGLDRFRKHPHDLRAHAPGDVKARHRVAVPVRPPGAPFRPAHVEQEPHAPRLEVPLHVVGREVDKGLGPLPRPVVLLLPVEGRRVEPVAHGELARVPDAQAPLLRAVDAKYAAQRPEGLPAQVRGVLLVDDDDRDVVAGELEGGDEPGQAAADDEDGLWFLIRRHEKRLLGMQKYSQMTRASSFGFWGAQRSKLGLVLHVQ